MPTRRDLLKTTAVAAASCILPKKLFATPAPNFHFINTDTQNSWLVTDPVQWSLQNSHEPILERAADGLRGLAAADNDRIIRLVLRRCGLNLLEIQCNRVHVQFWGTNGQADLKPFFKTHGLARPEIEVVLRDRNKETVTTLTGDSFLYGVPIASDFDMDLFQQKWANRFVHEPDDRRATPGTSSGFAWANVQDGMIPWAALKSAWRRGASEVCLNCSGPTILTNFGLRHVGMFNRASCFDSVCGTCRRSFRGSVEDAPGWMAMNLDEDVQPSDELIWGRRVARGGEGRA